MESGGLLSLDASLQGLWLFVQKPFGVGLPCARAYLQPVKEQ